MWHCALGAAGLGQGPSCLETCAWRCRGIAARQGSMRHGALERQLPCGRKHAVWRGATVPLHLPAPPAELIRVQGTCDDQCRPIIIKHVMCSTC